MLNVSALYGRLISTFRFAARFYSHTPGQVDFIRKVSWPQCNVTGTTKKSGVEWDNVGVLDLKFIDWVFACFDQPAVRGSSRLTDLTSSQEVMKR